MSDLETKQVIGVTYIARHMVLPLSVGRGEGRGEGLSCGSCISWFNPVLRV